MFYTAIGKMIMEENDDYIDKVKRGRIYSEL